MLTNRVHYIALSSFLFSALFYTNHCLSHLFVFPFFQLSGLSIKNKINRVEMYLQIADVFT